MCCEQQGEGRMFIKVFYNRAHEVRKTWSNWGRVARAGVGSHVLGRAARGGASRIHASCYHSLTGPTCVTLQMAGCRQGHS